MKKVVYFENIVFCPVRNPFLHFMTFILLLLEYIAITLSNTYINEVKDVYRRGLLQK